MRHAPAHTFSSTARARAKRAPGTPAGDSQLPNQSGIAHEEEPWWRTAGAAGQASMAPALCPVPHRLKVFHTPCAQVRFLLKTGPKKTDKESLEEITQLIADHQIAAVGLIKIVCDVRGGRNVNQGGAA